MKVQWQDIGLLRESSVEDINKTIIIPAKEALKLTRQALTGNLTLRDNQYAAIVTLGSGTQSCTSGVEYTLQNPLKTKPIGFTPINATTTAGTAIAIGGYRMNTSRTDGLLGLIATQNLLGGTGDTGEFGESIIGSGSAVSLTTLTFANITSMSITAGSWVISGGVHFGGSPTGVVFYEGGFSQTTVNPGTRGDTDWVRNSAVALDHIALPSKPVTLATSTTYFLVAAVQFSGGTCNAYGRISAVRIKPAQNQMIVTGILWGG